MCQTNFRKKLQKSIKLDKINEKGEFLLKYNG
jgi:hypothetical protein